MGYSKDIFTQPQQTNTLQCIICSDIAQFPVQCVHCDTLFCEKCLDDHKKMNKTCPYCKQGDLQVREINRLLKILMGSLQVRCRNEGCNQILNLEKLDQHESGCQFLKIYCKNFGCKKSTYKKDVEIHEAFCQFKLIDCSYCMQTFRQSEFVKHQCVQTLKTQLVGFQESIDRMEKRLDVVNQMKQIVQTQNEKIQQLELDRKALKDLISEVQINYQYALSQLQKNSIELEGYRKETQDQVSELSTQVSELTYAVKQVQKLQNEQNCKQVKHQEVDTIIEVAKIEHIEKKPKKKVKKEISADNSREENKEDKQNTRNQVNVAYVELEAEEEQNSPKKELHMKQITPNDIQKIKQQEDIEVAQIKDNRERKSPKYIKQNQNSKANSTLQGRNQESEKPIQLKSNHLFQRKYKKQQIKHYKILRDHHLLLLLRINLLICKQ